MQRITPNLNTRSKIFGVTILVFLAALVQHDRLAATGTTQDSYNPCFSGSSSATQTTESDTKMWYQVTILVFLAALVQRGSRPRDMSMFRVTILVFLAALVQLNRPTSFRTWSDRYNPCFSGSSSATTWFRLLTSWCITTLQSLFFWQL